MNVLVVGANGQIGKQVVKKLHESKEHSVKAMVRKEEQAAAWKEQGVETVLSDLEGSVEQLTQAFKGADAIIFTAGSGGHTGPDKTLLIDLDGAVKTMEAAKAVEVDRYVLVSAYDAHIRENWHASMRPYYVAKHYADRLLEDSGLNYTIVRPGGLVNEPGVGLIAAGDAAKPGTISREDVANVLIATLDNQNTYKKSFNVVQGDVPISQALDRT